MGSSPFQGIQPIFSEEYIEKKKDAHVASFLKTGLVLSMNVVSGSIKELVGSRQRSLSLSSFFVHCERPLLARNF